MSLIAGSTTQGEDWTIVHIIIVYCMWENFGRRKNWQNFANVTEYWKTDHVRTFGQLLFIGPANSHTHTLPVHCCINGLS